MVNHSMFQINILLVNGVCVQAFNPEIMSKREHNSSDSELSENSHDMSPFKQHKLHLNDEVDPVILPDTSEDEMVGSGRSLENLILRVV